MRVRNLLSKLALSALLVLLLSVATYATAPTATSFSATASTVGATLLQLQGADADGTALVYAIGTSPTHGTISGLDTATGYLVFTPTSGYTGSDTFTYTVTSGGATTSPATVTLTVTNAKTRIVDTLVNPDGSARTGKVTFILAQKVISPAGLIPLGSSVSAVLNSSGQFDVSVYPSSALSPTAYYQVWHESLTGRREPLGVYSIPATSASSILLTPYAVTNAALAAQYTFFSLAALNSVASGLAGSVTAFNGRTGSITPTTGDYNWAQITKTTSSFADITTRSASVIDTGTLPDARFPSTLPALNGSALTALNATNLASGTVGTARLGSGTANSSTFLRGDSTWAAPSFVGGTGTTGNIPYLSGPSTLADSPWLRYGSGTVGFATGTAAGPSTSSQLTGTRILFYPGTTGEHLGMGVESGKLWFNVGSTNAYKFYWAASSAETFTFTPSTHTYNSSSTTFTQDFQTSGDDTVGALIFSTNARAVRMQPGGSTDNRWDFVAGYLDPGAIEPTLRPFNDDSQNLGDTSHRIHYAYLRYISRLEGLEDTNGNYLLTFTPTSSAVNYFRITNAATGGRPSFKAIGSDTNISPTIAAKGSGLIYFDDGTDTRYGQFDPSQGRFRFNTSAGGYFTNDSNSVLDDTGVQLKNAGIVSWGASGAYYNGTDTAMKRSAPAVVGFTNASSAGGTWSAVARSPSQITSNQNDYNPGGVSHYLRLNTDASRNITGLTFSTTQVDGQTHVIVNVGSTDIVLKHQDAGSTAANRFLNSTGADITLTANQMADCWYDATTARWRVSKRN